jgi:hypothetical protein
VGDEGLEPSPFFSADSAIPAGGGTNCGTLGAAEGSIDPELATLIAAWQRLSPAARVKVLALAERLQDGD